MAFDDKDIDAFIGAWRKQFSEELTRDAARAEVGRLVDFLLALREMFPAGVDDSKGQRGTMMP